MDKFLLAYNPGFKLEDQIVCIVHTADPILIIEIHQRTKKIGDKKNSLSGSYKNSKGEIADITLIETSGTIDLNTAIPILNNALKWYSNLRNVHE